MLATVVIPSYQGGSKIGRVLSSLLQQSEKRFEVIVVVDGSTDNTVEIATSFVPQFQSLKIVFQKNSGRSATRNRGATEATTRLLIFFDDDMVPEIDCVKKHLSFHDHTQYHSLLSGTPIEITENTGSDMQRYRVIQSKGWMSKYPVGVSKMDHTNLFFTAANCSVPVNVFEKLGGFDIRLPDAEDFDIAYRAIEMGMVVYLDTTNCAEHHDPVTCRKYIQRIREYSTAHKKLQEHHPNLKSRSVAEPTSKMKLYRFFANEKWVRWIDQGKLLWLPSGVRYRLYSAVIHSLGKLYPHVKL